MSSLDRSSSTGSDPRVRVPVKVGFANRFYEPIVLLDTLNAACKRKPYNDSDPSSDMTQSPERTFQCFVNKLAQLCDSDKGGKTVTAFTVLQHPDHIEYRFTSNQRDNEDFIRAQNFTTSILHILGSMEGREKQSVISNILQTSMSFSRSRVTVYMRILKNQAVTCISACKVENTIESLSILEKLQKLSAALQFSDEGGLNDDAFAKQCERLIKFIDHLHQSEVHRLIYDRTKEGKINESESWSEFRHTAGRLLSYFQAAKFLVSMPRRWPELFESPRVCYITSSIPDLCPFRGKHAPGKMTAHGIIGRMTSNLDQQEEYRAHAEELQRVGLDQSLQTQAKKRTLRPIVHAEVLLLESLEGDSGTHPSKFFNGYKYIGCSKPTCRLCCHYFSVHPSGVEVRPTHHNLYPAWRMPDVYKDQGPQAERGRSDLMNKVLFLIRKDAFRVLKEKLAEGKRHDSNTDSTYPRGSASVGSLGPMEDLMLSLSNLDIHSSDYKETMSSITEAGSFDEDEGFASEVVREDDGVVKLL